MIAAGGLVGIQGPVNAGLGRVTGHLPAALVSFTVGSLVLAVAVLITGEARGLGAVPSASWYYLLGGVLGATYVTTAILFVPRIGASGVAAATVAGQLLAALAIDRIGLFGVPQIQIGAWRLVGVGLLFAGTALVIG